jgi:hypothetical protein
MRLQDISIDVLTDIFIEQYAIDKLRELGYSFEIYFDSHDIYAMIQGFWSLENKKGQINKEKIEIDDIAFVLRGMAYFGKIKNLKIFKPHMLEITRLLDRDYCFPIREIPQNLVNNLFEILQLEHINVFALNRNTQNPKIERHLHKLIRKSKNLFKAHYILAEPKWTTRADYLLLNEPHIFQRDEKSYKLDELTASDEYLNLRREFDSRRSDRTSNNLRDALSLCMLLTTVEHYKDNNLKKIPLFLASSDVIKEISQDVRFQDHFTITIEGRKINILKTTEFFLFDAIFSDYHNGSSRIFLKLNELKNKRLLFGDSNPREDLIESIKKDIAHFVDQEFYEILGSISENEIDFDFNTSITKFIDFQKAIKDSQFREQFQRERENIVSQLNKYVSDLQLFEDIWSDVEKIERVELNQNLLKKNRRLDIFRDTGLTRFSPPTGEVEKDLKQIWEALIYERDTGDDQFLKAQQKVVHCLFNGIQEKNTDLLIIGCGIMWVFEFYEIINKVLSQLNFNYKNYKLAALHAASLCRSNSPNKRMQVDNIILKIKSTPELYKKSYKAWTALSYINFKLWESETNAHYLIDKTPEEFKSAYYKYAVNAINLADKAYQWLRGKRNQVPEKVKYRNVKFYYLANIYIYYVSRAGAAALFLSKELEIRVETLEFSNKNFWQSTFDHTLATYYMRKCHLEKDANKKKTYLNKAAGYYESFKDHSLFKIDRLKILKDIIEVELFSQEEPPLP